MLLEIAQKRFCIDTYPSIVINGKINEFDAPKGATVINEAIAEPCL